MQKFRLILTLAVISLLSPTWAVAIAPMAPLDAPLFARVSVSQRRTTTDNAHAFTMTLPKRTGRQFAKLSFSFTESGAENRVAPIRFNLPGTQAFWGTPGKAGRAIAIDSAWVDETGTLWVEFKQPVASGSTITVTLKTQKASTGKPIEYGIAAYPKAGNSTAIFVGNGTLVVN